MKYTLLAPIVILSLLFTVWPLVEVVRLSLTETNFITTEWVGLANYLDAFSDRAFMRSMANSAVYIGLMVLMVDGTALVVSLAAFWLSKRWQDMTRFAFYIPTLAGGIIIAQVWKWVFHINGPVNWLIGFLGLGPVSFFSRWYTGIPAITLTVAAASVGGCVIILLATMLSIDRDLFAAATIDGASERQIKWRVVVPIIAPTLGMLVLIATIAAPQIFETVYAMAPYDYTATMSFHIYRQAFQMSRYGMASAQAVILLVLMAGVTYAKQRIERHA